MLDFSDLHEVEIINQCNEISKMLSNSKEQMKKTSIGEIRRLIRSLKPKKSVGFDEISNFMIKKLPTSYIECLVVCFNK